MAASTSFSPGASLAAIASDLFRTCGTQACSDVLKVIAAFCGRVVIVLFLLATAASLTSTGSFGRHARPDDDQARATRRNHRGQSTNPSIRNLDLTIPQNAHPR
jgi:hypothetical protein